MTARLLVNENFPVPSLQLLRQAGFDVASVSEVMPGSSDVDVIARAFDEDRGSSRLIEISANLSIRVQFLDRPL